MSNGQAVVSEAASTIKTWGPLGAFIVLAGFGGYGVGWYLALTLSYEHKRFEARQAREERLITLMESQHKNLQLAALGKLERQETALDQLSKHADLMAPLMTRLRHWLDAQGALRPDGIVRGRTMPQVAPR